jgi:hypothetical protein
MKPSITLKRLTALMLVLTMLVPNVNVTLAGDYGFPETPPYEGAEPLSTEEYLQSIIIPEPLLMLNHELSELSSEEVDELIRNQKAAQNQTTGIIETAKLNEIINSGVSFSELPKEDVTFIYQQLDISSESADDVNALFSQMESADFTLSKSVELIRIISTGLFSYEEALELYNSIPCDKARRNEIKQFEWFAQLFDIADAVNANRLVNEPFEPQNDFSEPKKSLNLSPPIAEIITPQSVAPNDYPYEYPTFLLYTDEDAFNEARNIFLNISSIEETTNIFVYGAAVDAEPSLFEIVNAVYEGGFNPPLNTGSKVNATVQAATWTDFDICIGDIYSYGAEIMTLGIAAMPESVNDDVLINPFGLGFDTADTVSLNTGASMYRVNVLNMPGRNGFDLNLDLVYKSTTASVIQKAPYEIAVGWEFDLPYTITSNNFYIPGRGILERAELPPDIRYYIDTGVSVGAFRSTHRLQSNDGLMYYFSEHNIIAMFDKFGNSIKFDYYSGNLHNIYDSNNNRIEIRRSQGFWFDNTPYSFTRGAYSNRSRHKTFKGFEKSVQ